MNRGPSRAVVAAGTLITYVVLLLPTLVIIGASFNVKQTTAFPPQGFSLHWYGEAIRQFGHAFTLSVILGATTAAVAIPLAVPAALAIVRYEFRGRNAIQALLLSPLFVPSLLIGVSLLSAFLTIELQGTFVALLLAHVLLTFPYVVRTVLASLQGIPRIIEESAATLGANPRQVMQHVTVPMMSSGIFAGALFAFLVSFGEINASVFVAGPSTTTLPIQLFSYLAFNSGPVVAAISVLQICLILVVVAVIERTVGLGKALQFG
jgi:putative spermidine/putrescine transport system permease protein